MHVDSSIFGIPTVSGYTTYNTTTPISHERMIRRSHRDMNKPPITAIGFASLVQCAGILSGEDRWEELKWNHRIE